MPANLLADMNANSGTIEDQRAFQIALDLSQLSLGNGLPHSDDSRSFNNSSPSSDENDLKKKGGNMTECVPVPSSEHVAEIVGRQGCKIKALRAKTNTYIKTPVRGEEPVFVVTGRKEDVQAAKREILSAAEHFSQIRATRRNNMANLTGTGSLPPSPNAPGQITIQVRVPYRVVGLVVGPKGATIKRIQQNTHTYIVTPSRDKEPVFEVTGSPENVERAREEIESHIAMRTGGMVDGTGSNDNDDFHNNGVDSGFHEISSDLAMFKSPKSAFSAYNDGRHSNNYFPQDMNMFSFPPPVTKISEYGLNGLNTIGMYDDEGIGGSPSFDPAQPVSSLWPEFAEKSLYPPTSLSSVVQRRGSLNGSLTPRLSPTLAGDANEHASVRRIQSDPLSTVNGFSAFTPFHSTTSSSLSSSSSTSPTSEAAKRRGCFVCSDNNITAALVPCGHNLFCMECANLICEKADIERRCPVCNQQCSQAIRIFS